MSIRFRMLLLLLVSTLAPLFMVNAIDNWTLRRFGATIAAETRQELTQQARQGLRRTLDSYTAFLDRKNEVLELILLAHSREVEQVLSHKPTAPPTGYFDDQFVSGKEPADVAPSVRHGRLDSDGGVLALNVSYKEPVFHLSPGLKKAQAAREAARLEPLGDMFRRTAKRYPDYFLWQFVSLENGLHMAYPGHGGFPQDFDPRRREWYQRAREEGEPVGVINIDAVSGTLLLTLCMPVYWPDGSFAGVTGFDAPLSSLLFEEAAAYPWSKVLRTFIVQVLPTSGGQKALSIFAELTREPRRPTGKGQLPDMLLSDSESYHDVVEDIEAGGWGVRQMPYEGEPMLWAWKAVGRQGAAMMLLAPLSSIVADAEATEQEILQYSRRLTIVTLIVVLAVAAGGVLVALMISRSIVRPLGRLALAARRLAQGDFEARANIRSQDELGEVGRTFDAMVPRLLEGFRMRESLEVAARIQRHLLPEAPPSLTGLDVEGVCVYSGLTGGDYYDYLPSSVSGELTVVVGDVTGHGVPSALLMTAARTLLRYRSALPGRPADVLADVNRHLTSDIKRSHMFMTCMMLQISQDRRTLRWATAGHDPALVYDPDTDSFAFLSAQGLPLGVQEDTVYEQGVAALKPGQVVVVGTDGVWETRNTRRELFGHERLMQVIRGYARAPAQGILTAVLESLSRFRDDLPQADDVTLLVLKITS